MIQPRVPQNELTVVMFVNGWGYYQDLAILTRTSTAQRVLARLIDYCSHSLQQFAASMETIASSAEFNPDNRDGISEIIMRLGMEVYYVALANKLFEIGPRDLPYQFGHIGPMRLYLQRLDIK